MFDRSALSQNLGSLWDEQHSDFTQRQIEIEIFFDKSLPGLGGTTGRMKYTLVPHHNECYLRDEIALYMQRYDIRTKFLMKIGQSLIDDITYERSISQALKSSNLLRLSVVPLAHQGTLTSSKLAQLQRDTTNPRGQVIDFTLPYKAVLQHEARVRNRQLHTTVAPNISVLNSMHQSIETASSKNSTMKTKGTGSSHSIGQSLVSSHSSEGTKINTSTANLPRRKERWKEEVLKVDMGNDLVLRRHELRNLRTEHELEVSHRGALKGTIEKFSACPLCGIDIESDDSIEQWMDRYKTILKRTCSVGIECSLDEWRELLKERLGAMSERNFLNKQSGTYFKVHLGCAEVSWDFQLGEDMVKVIEDGTLTKCDLCRNYGSTCPCSHPNCEKVYHTVCALFSPGDYPNGHVSFGLKPHLRRCPKCPAHREHSLRSAPSVEDFSTIEIDDRNDEIYRQSKRELI